MHMAHIAICVHCERFTTRKGFIYMLEVMACVMATVFLGHLLPRFFTLYVDNQAGKCALPRGYGSDPRVNTIITAFWSLVSHEGW